MPDRIKAPDFQGITKKLLADLVVYASVAGLNHIKEAFDKGGFTDVGFEPWQKRKDGDTSRALLVNTANLRDSNEILERSLKQIVFVNTATYASVHNEGGNISFRVTPKARKFFWYMFKATRKIKWKYMALTKKDRITIKIVARPFMKESQTLTNNINDWVTSEIVTRYK